MASKEIAIRHLVRFGYGKATVKQPLPAPLPRNTLDPRYVACIQHRTACDCREAEFAENVHELRAELQRIRQMFDEMLLGHATWVWGVNEEQEQGWQCKCIGCQLARRVGSGYANTAVLDPPQLPATQLSPLIHDDAGEVPF